MLICLLRFQPSEVPTSLNPTQIEPSISPSAPPTTAEPTTESSTKASPPASLPSTTDAPASFQAALQQTVTVRASKDTFIDASNPYTKYGNSWRLRIDGAPRVWSVLAFDMTSITASVQTTVRKSLPNHHDIRQLQNIRLLTAKLRMYAIDEGGGGTFFVLPNANEWSEDALTWSSQDDELDRTGELQVGSVDWVDAFKWAEIDVTGAFNNYHFDSGNDLTFLFKPGSMNGVTFASRERNSGALSPELVLTFSAVREMPTNLFEFDF